jgi:uncharacterized membrane protein
MILLGLCLFYVMNCYLYDETHLRKIIEVLFEFLMFLGILSDPT